MTMIRKKKRMKPTLTLAFVLLTGALNGQECSIVAQDAVIEKIETGYAFTEGPAVAKDGSVYFTDQPNDRIYRWDEKKGITLWLEGTERSNGMYFNRNDQLVACADEHNRILLFESREERKVLLEEFEGEHLNGPNDLWIAPNGDIYLTDAYYHRGYWPEGQHEIQEVRGVYHLNPEGKVTRVIGDYKQPNGIIGTPDGKTLYVADIGDRKIWRYDILFITARTSVYSLKMHVKGVQ